MSILKKDLIANNAALLEQVNRLTVDNAHLREEVARLAALVTLAIKANCKAVA